MDRKKVKGEVVPLHAMKTCRGNGGIVPLIVNLASTWKPVINLTSGPPPPQKEHLVAVEYNAG
jgi:hypothetical protein